MTQETPLDFTRPLVLADGTEVVLDCQDGHTDDALLIRADGLPFTIEQYPGGYTAQSLLVSRNGCWWMDPTGPQIVRNRAEANTPVQGNGEQALIWAMAKAIHRARFPATYTAHEDYWQQLSEGGRQKWFDIATAAHTIAKAHYEQAIIARRNIYVEKRKRHDPMAESDRNHWEAIGDYIMAFDYLLTELGMPLPVDGDDDAPE